MNNIHRVKRRRPIIDKEKARAGEEKSNEEARGAERNKKRYRGREGRRRVIYAQLVSKIGTTNSFAFSRFCTVLIITPRDDVKILPRAYLPAFRI